MMRMTTNRLRMEERSEYLAYLLEDKRITPKAFDILTDVKHIKYRAEDFLQMEMAYENMNLNWANAFAKGVERHYDPNSWRYL